MATVNAASASRAHVAAAIALASANDTVTVPAGTATWASQLAYTKAISLIGNGIGSTVITAGFDSPYPSLNPDNFLIYYLESAPVTNNTVRISGFSFDLDNRCEGLMIENASQTAISNVRIDNCNFENSNRYINFEGTIYGCVDNNVIWAATTGLNYRFISIYGNIGGDQGVGQWTNNTFSSGSANNIYFEDNDIYWSGLDTFSSGIGGRYCLRHNNWHYVDGGRWTLYCAEAHGNMGGATNRGTMGVEFYENTFDGTYAGNPVEMFSMRGGKGVLYENHFPATVGSLATGVTEEYNDSADLPANNVISGQPQHLSDYYVWSNAINSTDQVNTSLPVVATTIDYGGATGVVPRNGVHFWRQVNSFDGTAGVGVGLLAARPATCTTGVGYWATDTSILYRAVATNTWEAYYTPYTYPHPLRGAGVAPDVMTVTSPNGGESWAGNSGHNITWTNTGDTVYANVKIQYSADSGVTWTNISASTANTGSYAWTVPNSAAGTYMIKVSAVV
jgi:hypothetical protein